MTNATIDTAGATSFDASPLAAAKLAALGVLMTALSLLAAVPILPNVAPGSYGQAVGWAGTAFFALCTVFLAARAATMRGPVVILTPDGVRDVRLSNGVVPWSAVQALGTFERSGQRLVVLRIPDAAWDAIDATRLARLTRGANARLGADGYCITAQGLRTGIAPLEAAIRAYLDRYVGFAT